MGSVEGSGGSRACRSQRPADCAARSPPGAGPSCVCNSLCHRYWWASVSSSKAGGAGLHERFLTWKNHFHRATQAGGRREELARQATGVEGEGWPEGQELTPPPPGYLAASLLPEEDSATLGYSLLFSDEGQTPRAALLLSGPQSSFTEDRGCGLQCPPRQVVGRQMCGGWGLPPLGSGHNAETPRAPHLLSSPSDGWAQENQPQLSLTALGRVSSLRPQTAN